MFTSKKRLVGAVVAVTAAVTALGAGTALGASDKPPGAAAAGGHRTAPDRAAATAVSPATQRALTALQTRIAGYVAKHGTAYTFGSYLDGTTGRIVLSTNAPAGVVSSLTTLPGAAAAERQVAARAQVHRAVIRDSWNRRDDIQPYYGGGGIQSGGALCSSGYAVRNAVGTRFMTTAGHCFANGATVFTESGLNVYGTVSNRHLPTVTGDAKDMELIGGRSYAGRVFTGGVLSTSSIPVVAAGSAVVGYTAYCHSGRTTGEACGHTARSTTAQVCTQTGCKSPVIAFTGGTMIQGGDSGGAFYAKDGSGAWIRGNVIASDGVTGWATPWTVVSSTLGVSIVTG